MRADGLKMVAGIYFDLIYAPAIDRDSFLLQMIAIVVSMKINLYFLDISNTFQSNMLHNQAKQHCITLPTLYMRWFKLPFPNHPFK